MTTIYTEVFCEYRQQWRTWLSEHHAQARGVWLVFYKKSSRLAHVSYDEAVEEALCFGWIDSKPGKVDVLRSKLYFAPRKPGSGWSKPNKDRIATLLSAGLMMPAGLAVLHAAQADGSWTMLDAVEALVIPEDLALALAEHPNASEHFMAFPRSAKRGILEWIAQAKRPETRAARVAETARLAQNNLRANQWRGSKQ
jgi:uncharacterized protein YdeI (YjbR/CyaY-like superfamily)